MHIFYIIVIISKKNLYWALLFWVNCFPVFRIAPYSLQAINLFYNSFSLFRPYQLSGYDCVILALFLSGIHSFQLICAILVYSSVDYTTSFNQVASIPSPLTSSFLAYLIFPHNALLLYVNGSSEECFWRNAIDNLENFRSSRLSLKSNTKQWKQIWKIRSL